MKFIILLALLIAGCGNEVATPGLSDNGLPSACTGVDTSRAPDAIITNADGTTSYYWGNCVITY